MPVEERIKKIIAHCFCVNEEKVLPKASFIADLDADSLDIVELVMMLEEEFDITIPDEKIEEFINIKNVIDCVNRLTIKK